MMTLFNKEELSKALHSVDKDADGMLAEDELYRYMTHFGEDGLQAWQLVELQDVVE